MNVAARLLADENVPGAVVAALRHDGHDVAWIHEDAPGSPDPDVWNVRNEKVGLL